MGLTVVGKDGVIKCPKCKSPMNVIKARRRYVKAIGRVPEWEYKSFWGSQVTVGDCSCGEHVFYHIENEE